MPTEAEIQNRQAAYLAEWKHLEVHCRACDTRHLLHPHGGDVPECCPDVEDGVNLTNIRHDGTRGETFAPHP